MSDNVTVQMPHVECPACGEEGNPINQPCTSKIDVSLSEHITVCYGDFGVVLHRPVHTE